MPPTLGKSNLMHMLLVIFEGFPLKNNEWRLGLVSYDP